MFRRTGTSLVDQAWGGMGGRDRRIPAHTELIFCIWEVGTIIHSALLAGCSKAPIAWGKPLCCASTRLSGHLQGLGPHSAKGSAAPVISMASPSSQAHGDWLRGNCWLVSLLVAPRPPK